MLTTETKVHAIVEKIVNETQVTDVHTHLYAPHFKELLLAGIDELLTYHYLIAEVMRESDITYDDFWKLNKKEQADLIWKTLFIENTPYSEACRGVVTALQKLGMDLKTRDLDAYREELAISDTEEYVTKIFELSGVKSVVMTNDPFDPVERALWDTYHDQDSRFHAALRIDPLLNDFKDNYQKLQGWGYDVDPSLNDKSIQEIQRFISEWVDKMEALYIAVSLPNTFIFPEDSIRSKLISEAILPVCRQKNIPFAMMIGVKRGVNKALDSAGDGTGKAPIDSVEMICSSYPKNKFMVTMLSKENQHELAVAGRKFRNLMVFGCWWFLNNPSVIEEITKFRFELLGSSVIPQHSDARILDQLAYKWEHSREVIVKVLTEKYEDLIKAGWDLQEEEIVRDVEKLFGGNFWRFIQMELS
jgi:hypothetical protein